MAGVLLASCARDAAVEAPEPAGGDAAAATEVSREVAQPDRKDAVHIKQFHLREIGFNVDDVESLRADRQKRLYGAVTKEEQRNRLGHYYIVRWDGPKGRESEPVRLVFDYRQAATGRAVRRMEVDLPGTRKGVVEFQVIGDQYLKSGRVLAWKLDFYRGGERLETHRSYLWD